MACGQTSHWSRRASLRQVRRHLMYPAHHLIALTLAWELDLDVGARARFAVRERYHLEFDDVLAILNAPVDDASCQCQRTVGDVRSAVGDTQAPNISVLSGPVAHVL